MDRVAKVKWLDATRIANAIECTRHGADDSDGEEGMLVRAANLIGQLGDPQYLRKANALYYEFEEVGRNSNSAIFRRPISPIYIRSFIGAAYRRISRAPCATSTSRRTDGGGSPTSTAISSAPSTSYAGPVQNPETGVHAALGASVHIRADWRPPQCPLWVISGYGDASAQCPLFPKRGLFAIHSITSSARRWKEHYRPRSG